MFITNGFLLKFIENHNESNILTLFLYENKNHKL